MLVTRYKSRACQKYNLKGCFVALSKNPVAEAKVMFSHYENKPNRFIERRASIAGQTIFDVDDAIIEIGHDFLPVRADPNNLVENDVDAVAEAMQQLAINNSGKI